MTFEDFQGGQSLLRNSKDAQGLRLQKHLPTPSIFHTTFKHLGGSNKPFLNFPEFSGIRLKEDEDTQKHAENDEKGHEDKNEDEDEAEYYNKTRRTMMNKDEGRKTEKERTENEEGEEERRRSTKERNNEEREEQ